MPIESSTKTDEIVEVSMLFRNHHAEMTDEIFENIPPTEE
jgi:hypothetical protein